MRFHESGLADALYGLGYWLLDHQRYADAKHVFRTMLLVAPTDDRGWLALGICHEGISDLDRAVHLYDLGRRACRAGGAVRCALALGRALRRLGRDDEASQAYADAQAAAQGDDELDALIALEAT